MIGPTPRFVRGVNIILDLVDIGPELAASMNPAEFRQVRTCRKLSEARGWFGVPSCAAQDAAERCGMPCGASAGVSHLALLGGVGR